MRYVTYHRLSSDPTSRKLRWHTSLIKDMPFIPKYSPLKLYFSILYVRRELPNTKVVVDGPLVPVPDKGPANKDDLGSCGRN